MRASATFRDWRRLAAPGRADVAFCATQSDDFRSWPPTASIAVWSNFHFSEYLRPKPHAIGAAQFRRNRDKAIWELEIRQPKKKMTGFRLLLTHRTLAL